MGTPCLQLVWPGRVAEEKEPRVRPRGQEDEGKRKAGEEKSDMGGRDLEH